MPAKHCDSCESTTNLQFCSRCKTTPYCSQTCQRSAWPTHKLLCKPLSQFLELLSRFSTHPQYIAVLKMHINKATEGFPAGSRKIVHFAFADRNALKQMLDLEFLGSGGSVAVEVRIVRPTEEKQESEAWEMAMDFCHKYDLQKEAVVVFSVGVDDGHLLRPYVVEFKQ